MPPPPRPSSNWKSGDRSADSDQSRPQRLMCSWGCATEQRLRLLGAAATWRGPSLAAVHTLFQAAQQAWPLCLADTQKPCSSLFSREAGEKGIEGPPKPELTQAAGTERRSAPSFFHTPLLIKGLIIHVLSGRTMTSMSVSSKGRTL